MCQLFVDAIVNSLKKVPVALNYVSAALVEGVEFKFPEAVRVVIAGFFFLRFLCPAIVSPEGYDIIPKGFLNARGRRGLVLVSKVRVVAYDDEISPVRLTHSISISISISIISRRSFKTWQTASSSVTRRSS